MEPDDDAPEVIIVNNEGEGDPPPPDEPEPPPALPAEVAAAIDLAASQATALAAERVAGFVEEVNQWRGQITSTLEAQTANLSALEDRMTAMETSLSLILARVETTTPTPATTTEEEPGEVPVVESGGGAGEPVPPEAPPSQSRRKRPYVLV